MLKLKTMPHSRKPTFLQRLKKYSTSDVLANNTYRQVFLDTPSWSSWIEDTFKELLQVPSGNELHVTLHNELDSEQTQTLIFMQREISIGRAAENDISLPLQSISRHHARIFEKHGDFFVEDMRSVSGTYVNRRKLDPSHPCRLSAGDEVLMFPYILRVESRDLWKSDETVRLTYSSSQVLVDTGGFASGFGPETCLFQISVHPEMGYLLLAVSMPLVETIIARLLRSNEIRLVDSDKELVEFVAACVLERANLMLHFPFECSLMPLPQSPSANEMGLMLEAFVKLSDARGCIRIFAPEALLQRAPKAKESLPSWMKTSLKWRLALRVGFVDLETRDFEQMEPGDILLYTSSCDLVLPTQQSGGAQQRGWRIMRDESDARRFSIEHFHEWSTAMPADEMHEETNTGASASTGMADLSTLPVRLHIVLGHVDMDLSVLEGLKTGSIIQLDADTHGAVQLVVGETVFGSGELVELEDDRLGIQITRWREQ
jgi:type III secretion system YscQ/HrcQ family protein